MSVCPSCNAAAAIERPYLADQGHPLFADRSVSACPQCGLRFCSPMPSSADLDAYYESGDYDHGSRPEAGIAGAWTLASERAIAHCNLLTRVLGHPPASILDVGAGYGVLLDEGARRGARTGGVDPTPIRLDRMRSNGHEVWLRIDDAPSGWEVVAFSHVLEHVPDPLGFLRSTAAMLAPGGVLFCEVPNIDPIKPDPDEPHVTFFTPQALAETMTRAGMTVLLVSECGRRTGKGWDRLSTYTKRAKASGLLPSRFSGLDAMHRCGESQGRIYLRCVATPTDR